MGTVAHDTIEIGDWRATCATGELARAGEVAHLEPKVMDLLLLLAEHGGAVVTHEQILERLWPRVVVGEDTLARTVSKLRKALRDTARPARYVGTVPKRGYRLLVPVRIVRAGANAVPSDGAPLMPSQSEHPAPRLLLRPRWAMLRERRSMAGFTLAAALAVAVGFVATLRPSTPEAATSHLLAERAEDFYFQYSYADNQAAIALYERIVALKPDYARAHAGLANALVQKAVRWPAGVGAIQYARLRDALQAGHLRSASGRALLDRAQRLAELAVELAPDDAATHKALGLVRSARSDFAGALAAYRRSVSLDPDAWGALINIGDVLEILGEDAQALRYLESARAAMTRVYSAHAARTHPWYAALGVAIGDRYLARGDLPGAEQAYRRVLEHSPLDPAATRQLATTLRRRGEPQAARALCAEFARQLGAVMPVAHQCDNQSG